MARDLTTRSVHGDILPPERQHLLNQVQQQLPYADPQELLHRMGGFIHRWSMRGKAAASVEISQQFERLYSSYANLYQSVIRLERGRVEHALALDDLRHLDEILEVARRRRRQAAAHEEMRDQLTTVFLEEQLEAAEQRLANVRKKGATAQEVDDTEVPMSPAEQLEAKAKLRRDLHSKVGDLEAQIRREAGSNPLSSELEEELQRIRDDAERLILHAASEQ